ncbi:flavodoxin family protein [Mycoplasma sp. P36-A1]|uniref:flavodoxin family protein n=1 Tax=Mycoplasma sp. P36-A1 TaxID=3252900 RepID=UPI003C2EFAFB
MKIIAINASARANGNTEQVILRAQERLEANNIQVEVINIATKLIHGCIACEYCHKKDNTNNECVFKDDIVNEVTKKLREADGIIVGSPTYYGGITGNLKSLLDRAFYTNSDLLSNKVALPFVVERRGGGMDALRQIENYFALASTYLVPTRYWSVLHGRKIQEVLNDDEGLLNIDFSVESMIKMLAHKDEMKLGEMPWKMTNFFAKVK